MTTETSPLLLPLAPGTLADLLAGLPIVDREPWNDPDAQAVDRACARLFEAVCADAGAHMRLEAPHYGSGYASFVDAWFYRPVPEAALPEDAWPGRPADAQAWVGLHVLACRLAPCVAFMQGVQGWRPDGSSSSCLPSLAAIDALDNPVVAALAGRAQALFERHGWTRVRRDALAVPLPVVVRIETNLGGAPFSGEVPFTTFDALFRWMD